MKYLYLILMASLCFSCSHVKKEECKKDNWFEVGKSDAKKGLSTEYFLERQQACIEYGFDVKKTQYMAGFKEGLSEFCKPKNAYEFGLKGGAYKDTCPLAQKGEFLSHYQKGKKVFTLERQLDSLNREIDRLNQELVNSGRLSKNKSKVVQKLREKERKKQEILKRISRQKSPDLN